MDPWISKGQKRGFEKFQKCPSFVGKAMFTIAIENFFFSLKCIFIINLLLLCWKPISTVANEIHAFKIFLRGSS